MSKTSTVWSRFWQSLIAPERANPKGKAGVGDFSIEDLAGPTLYILKHVRKPLRS